MTPDLSWITGSWRMEKWGGLMEEHWTSAFGDSLQGMNRVVRDGKVVHREFMWIQEEDGGVFLSILLPNRSLEPIRYRLTEACDREAVFENPEHERLSRMVYRRDGEKLDIRVFGVREGSSFEDTFLLSPTSLVNP